eukprot:4530265-Pleurochrysis_carterae.AAC.1
MRWSEFDRKAVSRQAKGSIGTAVRRGAIAACARVNWAEERERMAEEWPSATDSAAKSSKSAAKGREEADLLASASNLALSARRRMTAAGESSVRTRVAT